MIRSLDQWVVRWRICQTALVAEVLFLALAVGCFALPFELAPLPFHGYAKSKEGYVILALAAQEHPLRLIGAGLVLMGLTLGTELVRRRMQRSLEEFEHGGT